MRSAKLTTRSSETAASAIRLAPAHASAGLRAGATRDSFEREADRAANQVIAGSGSKLEWSLSKVQTGGALQRKCSCGGSGHAEGECEECRKKEMLQRRATGLTTPSFVPAIVQDVLGSPGHPLDAATRAYFEPRFGHDFGRVRIHSDARAAESAQAVNALAYTVGNHISFGAASYHPQSREGRQLMAHELAHVVQQSQSGDAITAGESHFEAEADHAASEVTSASTRPALTGRGQPGLQRQKSGASTSPTPVAPTANQQKLIDAARRAAGIRCQIALHLVRGIVPPGPEGRADPALEASMRARSLAQLMFNWDNPNMEQIGDVISSMVNFLTSGADVKVAAAHDPECGTRAAYVRGLRPPIVLCPTFFSDSPEQRIRTMIHESAHLARIGSGDLGESYCVDFDCKGSCGGFSSADSWAHFVHCLSGQKADQPITITGHGAAAGQTQAPRGGSGGKP